MTATSPSELYLTCAIGALKLTTTRVTVVVVAITRGTAAPMSTGATVAVALWGVM